MNVLQKLSSWFYTRTSGWLVLLFGAFVMIFNVVIFPFMHNLIGNGKEVAVLDPQFGFSQSEVFVILDALGVHGRSLYKTSELLVDGLYPLIYTALLVFLISYIYRKWPVFPSRWAYLNLFPFLTTLADYAENSGIVSLINSFPELAEPIVDFTSLANQIKWITVPVAILIVLVGVVGLLLRRAGSASA